MASDRVVISLNCTVCKNKNYYQQRSHKKKEFKVEVKKFCKKCGKSVLHKEGKLAKNTNIVKKGR